jgi:hypothetical protein
MDIMSVIIQLVFAIGSITNLALLCRSIALETISVMSCDFSDTIVPLWIGLAVVAHLGGIITFSRRYKLVHPNKENNKEKTIHERIRRWLRYEFSLCKTHREHKSKWEQGENRGFVVWSFLTSIYTTVHLASGILIFSSLSFVGMLTFSL